MRTLIISDLHLGNGGPYDVFEGEKALPSLLDRMSDAPLCVLVNGDGVDFLMNDDPLELDPARAVEQARAIVAHPASAAVLQAFGRVLERGGEVSIRLGNHDVELAFPEVQAVLRGALGQPAGVAARLAFATGEAPEILEVGGARVLVTHGEQDDRWNKVDYKKLTEQDKSYQYAPGSVLVKKVLNPGTGVHGLRFLSLLKPDFQGAALTALAVDATVAKQIFKGATLSMLLQLLRRKGMGHTFDEELGEEEGEQGEATLLSKSDLARHLDGALLDKEECEAIEALLDDNAIASFGDEDGAALGRASVKIARAALEIYARFHRRVTGKEGDEYFVLEPTYAEWTEAQRLAKKFDAGAVIIGHTHAARWKQDKGLLYANTGTWIGLMQLPRSDAGEEAWLKFLHELKQNKQLDPRAQKHARILTRFTAALVEPHKDGGAALSLVEWEGGELKTLGAGRVPPKEQRTIEAPLGKPT
jgi:UDP-2,3-diacylglucosamine pyrophosphatase LpxH